MPGKTVVILGGGTGGIVAANRLRRLLDREHRIVLIDRSPYHTYEASLTRVMTGERSLPRITRDFRTLRRKGIEVQTGEVTAIDFDGRVVTHGKHADAFDCLLIAFGADYSAEDVPGLNRAWTFYHGDGADGMREELESFASGRVVCAVSRLPYKCPPAFYEGVLLLDAYFRKRRLREHIEIGVYSPEPAPFPEGGPAVSEAISGLLASRDIAFTGGYEMKSVNHEKKLVNFRDGDPVPFDMLVSTPVHSSPFVLRESPVLGEDGWVAIDRQTMAPTVPGVYAIGDCTTVPITSGVLPKLGVLAAGEAEVAARNIAAEIEGRAPNWGFSGQGTVYLDTGDGIALQIAGDYFAEPPSVTVRGPGRLYHWSKLGAERLWLRRWF